jgi:phosphoglycerate dehydrogenase-like enzyme
MPTVVGPGQRRGAGRVRPYRVFVTGDQAFLDGSTIFGDIGLDRLTAAGIEWTVIPVPEDTVTAAQLRGADAVLLMGGRRIESQSLSDGALRHVARFGAGYDAVDVAACTAAGVVVTNTPAAVRTPMAHAALAMVLALAHELLAKDRLVRTGRWGERSQHQGRGLMGATVGLIGLGGVGEQIARIFRTLGVDVVAYNRTARPQLVEELGIRQLTLHEVAALSDYLVVALAGNPGTSGVVDSSVIASMRSEAFLINVSRGAVIDEPALVDALRAHRIRGAALDVFQHEPLEPDDALLGLDNVLLSPHSLCWTDGFARAVADSAISALIDVADEQVPRNVVNTEVVGVLEERWDA